MQYTSSQRPAKRLIGESVGPGIPERLLSRLWQRRAARQEWFRTQAGARVRVLYPGRPGLSAGPDFRGAILEMEGVGRVQGDVEIHVRQRDWDSHGHTGDPRYNGVVLHAALEVESHSTGLKSGNRAPVVSLSPLLAHDSDGVVGPRVGLWQLLEERGYARPKTPEDMGRLLDDAGDSRFLSKSREFGCYLEEQPAEQTLYEGLLEGLGYQHNQHAFSLLAQRAPYGPLAAAALRLPVEDRADAIETWLADLSGLARKHHEKQYTLEAEGLPKGLGPKLEAGSWNCFRVRPANHPLRRIAGAAHLVERFLKPGLVEGLRTAARAGKPKGVTASLTVAKSSRAPAAPVGQARARDLGVNVALPFFYALAHREGDAEEADERLRLYSRFGKSQENELTQEMTKRLLEPEWKCVVSTARRQQGLLHLHHVLTTPG